MTPTVRAASRLVSDPTTAMWFDVGQMPEYSGDCPVDVDMLMHPPFDRCAICGLDADGDLFVIAVTGGRENVQTPAKVRSSRTTTCPHPRARARHD